MKNREELTVVLGGILKTKDRAHWISRIVDAGVPASNINNIAETFADEQLHYREMIIDIPKRKSSVAYPEAAEAASQGKMIGCPFKFSETPIKYNLPAPLLSEHTSEVLQEELSMTDEEIAALKKEGII